MVEQKTIPQRRKLKLWHIGLVMLAVLAVAFGVFRIAVRAKLQSRIRAIRAAGYPVTISELDAWYAIPAYAENAADYITTGLTYLQIPEGEEAEGIPFFGRRAELPARTQPLDEQTLAKVAQLLDDNRKALGLLRQGAAIPDCRYPIDLAQGENVMLSHLSNIRSATRLRVLEAALCAEQRESEAATQAVLSGYGLARSLRREPVIISQLVRCACNTAAGQALERVLNRLELTDAQLAGIEATVVASYDPNAMSRAFAADRCFGLEMLRDPRAASGVGGPHRILLEISRALGLLDLGLVRYLDCAADYIAIAQIEPYRRQEAVAAVEAEQREGSVISAFTDWLAPAFGRVIVLDLDNVARLQVTRTAVAVERYRLANGRLPETLADLMPTFVQNVPADPFDGRPLRYRTLDPGYVVYSVGQDGTDDAGQERQPRRRGQEEAPYDIVFVVER